jgi:hypothetical protein
MSQFLVPAGQRLDLQDAVVVVEQGRGLNDRRLHSGRTEKLHGAQVVAPTAWMARGLRMPFHEQTSDAETCEEQ